MARAKIYRVRAVEGQMVVHPASAGTGQVQIIGHEKYSDPDDPRWPLGKPVPSQKYRFSDAMAEQVVLESGDGYVAAKIREGGLDYVETVDSFNAPRGSGTVDPALAKVTAANVKAREEAALLALAALAADKATGAGGAPSGSSLSGGVTPAPVDEAPGPEATAPSRRH